MDVTVQDIERLGSRFDGSIKDVPWTSRSISARRVSYTSISKVGGMTENMLAYMVFSGLHKVPLQSVH